MIAMPTALRRIVPLIAVVSVLALPRAASGQCVGIHEEGRWRNLDKTADPSHLDIRIRGGCGDQVLNGEQTGSRRRYTLRAWVRQSDGKFFGRPQVNAVYKPWKGQRWLQGNVSTGGYQDQIWARVEDRNGASLLHVFITHKSLDSKPDAHSEYWFVKYG
jgi:hypothetical protein